MKIKDITNKDSLRMQGIGHVNKVLEEEYIENKIIYVAGTPQSHSYNGFQKNTLRAYICKNNSIELLFYNLKFGRAKNAIKAWKSGHVGTVIPMYVWENYITNGWNTRRGLYADYGNKEERIKQIARSHADYLGCEIDSTTDHYNRVRMRNN